jgi:preprotein translocase subunit SecA
MFFDTCELLYTEGSVWEDFQMEVIRVFAHEVPMSENEFLSLHRNEAIQLLYDQCFSAYKERMQHLCEVAWPFIKNVAENTRYINVAFPITDGKKTLNVVVPVKKAYETHGREVQLSIEKGITLAIIDDLWKEHLRELDDLRQSVQNAAYEQKDPLLIYKFESFKLFEQMLLNINREITSFLSRAQLPVRQDSDVREARQPQSDQRGLRAGRDNSLDRVAQQQQQAIDSSRQQQKQMPVHVEKKVGRNDPCPCGSGKKYKNCHGKDAE